jgi:hypothetical protein
LALLTGTPPPTPAPPKPAAREKEQSQLVKEHAAEPAKTTGQKPHSTPAVNPPANLTPLSAVLPIDEPTVPALPPIAPVALPADLTGDTNAPAAYPGVPLAPIPAQVAAPDSAFVARDIAEKSLDPDIVAPTGRAELMKIVGKRDETQFTPTAWTFYFFDKKAAGHARIVTVTGGAVTKTGEDLVDFASPYSDRDILPEDELIKDSSDALQIAQGLVPGVTVTSSEFTLVELKNVGPMWKVSLWTKNKDGEDHKLGDVTLRADTGVPNSINLKP